MTIITTLPVFLPVTLSVSYLPQTNVSAFFLLYYSAFSFIPPETCFWRCTENSFSAFLHLITLFLTNVKAFFGLSAVVKLCLELSRSKNLFCGLFPANPDYSTCISLKKRSYSFLAKLGSIQLFRTWKRFFACLQLITLILAISHSEECFCFFATKLRFFQLYRTENPFLCLFAGCTLLLSSLH